jgi:hypothetical protein
MDDARQVANRVMEDHERLLPLILCNVTAGNVDEARQQIEEYLRYGRAIYSLYDDESIGRILRSSSYEDLRRAHPWEIPYTIGEDKAVLFLQQSPQWADANLPKMLRDLGNSVRVTRLPEEGENPLPRFAIWVDDARLLVSVHNRKYSNDEMLAAKLKSEPLRAAFEQHAAFISVSGSRWARPAGKRNCRELARDVALRFVDDDCLAIWLEEESRFLHNSRQDREAWLAAADSIEQGQLGEYLPMYSDWQESDFRGQRALDESLRQLQQAFADRQPEDNFAVAAFLRGGTSGERLWISLEEIRNGSQYVGRLVNDSLLAPEFLAGERLLVEEFELCGCRFQHAGRNVDAIVKDDQ